MKNVGLSAQIAEYIAGRAEARLDKFDKDAEFGDGGKHEEENQ